MSYRYPEKCVYETMLLHRLYYCPLSLSLRNTLPHCHTASSQSHTVSAMFMLHAKKNNLAFKIHYFIHVRATVPSEKSSDGKITSVFPIKYHPLEVVTKLAAVLSVPSRKTIILSGKFTTICIAKWTSLICLVLLSTGSNVTEGGETPREHSGDEHASRQNS